MAERFTYDLDARLAHAPESLEQIRSSRPLFGPHDVLERSDTYLYVPVH